MRGGKTTSIQELVAAGSLLLQFVLLAVLWPQLPSRVPSHFGISGAADAWGPKATLLLLPVVSAVIYAGLTLIGRHPHRLNYPIALTEENAPRQYAIAQSLIATVKAVTLSAFAYVTIATCRVATGSASGLGVFFLPLFLGALGITIAMHVMLALRAR